MTIINLNQENIEWWDVDNIVDRFKIIINIQNKGKLIM